MGMLTGTVEIRGTRPFFFHAADPEFTMPLEKQERAGVAGNNPDEWWQKRTFKVLPDGRLWVPADYALSTTAAGAAFTKKGKISYRDDVRGCVQIIEDKLIFDRLFPGKDELTKITDPAEPVYLDVRMAVNPSTKKKMVVRRVALAPGWTLAWSLEWEATVIDRHLMKTFLADAGRFSGIGNGRKIGMGRFEVVSFEIKEEIEKKAA